MYLLTAVACLASYCYEKQVVHMHGNFPNAMLAAAFLAIAMHMVKTAKTA